MKTDAAAAFLSALFAPYAAYPGARIEIRAFPPAWATNTGKPPRAWYATDAAGIGKAAADAVAWGQEWDVYFGVLPRTQGGGAASCLRLCQYLWCDIDGGEAGPVRARALLDFAVEAGTIPAPQVATCSGGGVHAYFRMDRPVSCHQPEEQERIRKVLKRIVLAIGGKSPDAYADRASAEPARVLRVAGTFNLKRQGSPRAVELLTLAPDAQAFSLHDIEKSLPQELVVARPAYSAPRTISSPDSLPPSILAKLTSGARDGEKHVTMRSVAVWAQKRGMDESVIRSYAEQCGAASGVPMGDPQQQRHLDQIVHWARQNVQPEQP